MVKIAEETAKKAKVKSIVTGDSLAQVASQTIENITAVNLATELPIIRPLICLDKEEIMEKAKEIGTYETSIEPHDDCCTRLMPKNPETKAKIKEVVEAEKLLDLKKSIEIILKKVEVLNI